MKITLERTNEGVLLEGKNERNLKTIIDGSPKIGGVDGGPSPMELVLMAAGGCSSMDVLSILKKMKQEVTTYRVEVEGKRAEDQVPAVFTDIHIQFFVGGDVDATKVARAIELSMDKYCSVTHMLRSSVNITSGYELV